MVWTETEATEKSAGRRMPIDADDTGRATVYEDGNLVIVAETGDRTPIVRYVGAGKFKSHFATCPDGDKWRKK